MKTTVCIRAFIVCIMVGHVYAREESTTPKGEDKKIKIQLTEDQAKYLNNYLKARGMAITLFRLHGHFLFTCNGKITLEDLRPHVVKHFKLPKNSS